MNSLKGYVLVASPQLQDPNFVRTVILMLHHSEEGAFGVVLNRPAENTVKQLWEKVGEGSCDNEQLVNVGGPVSGPLMALHTDASAAEMEVFPGLYFAAQRENLEKIVRENQHPLRIFVGHAGWGEGQLERELQQGAWLTSPANPEYVFCGPETDLWKTVAKHIGDQLVMTALKIKHVPEDPSLN
jgi:putative transcriptional regulator